MSNNKFTKFEQADLRSQKAEEARLKLQNLRDRLKGVDSEYKPALTFVINTLCRREQKRDVIVPPISKSYSYCPSCGRMLRTATESPYCPNCGQRLRWMSESTLSGVRYREKEPKKTKARRDNGR